MPTSTQYVGEVSDKADVCFNKEKKLWFEMKLIWSVAGIIKWLNI